MFVKPSYDRELENRLSTQVVDGTTVAASFFDNRGILTYPWRAEIEALAGRERHTLRLEARSWQIASLRLGAAFRVLSDFDLLINRRLTDRVDQHLLSEVHHVHLKQSGRVSVDRLTAVLSKCATLLESPSCSDSDSDLLFAAEIVLDYLPDEFMPFDGLALSSVDAECVGTAWGLYDVPETWDLENVRRSLWREQ